MIVNKLIYYILKYKYNILSKENIFFKDNNVYINWWTSDLVVDPYWLNNFIKNNFDFKDKIVFCSIGGKRKSIENYKIHPKIFFSGESLEKPIRYSLLKEDKMNYTKFFFERIFNEYKDLLINDVDLSISYSKNDNPKYIRFPYWMMYVFNPTCNYKDIKKRVEEINEIKVISNINKAVVINKHDVFGTRSKICNDISSVINIEYAGKWKNTTSDLWNKYNNKKIEYIKQFKYNICAENMDAPNYVTEKLFDAFLAGTIPIYHGAENNPEPDIINKERIVLWNFKGDNCENIKLLKKLQSDDNFYYKFTNQPKLLKNASEIIYDKFLELKNKLDIILE